MKTEKMRIAIIEDHPVMRYGLTSYFDKTGRWHVTGSASTLFDAKKVLAAAPVDIVLLDIQLKEGWSLDIIPWFKEHVQNLFATCPLMAVYSNYDDYSHVNAAMSLGVQAYICKRRNEEELEKALFTALGGEIYIDDSIQAKLQNVTNLFCLLTKRETEILCFVKSGLSNKQIAAHLDISRRTVENILSCVYYKTGIKTRLELQNL